MPPLQSYTVRKEIATEPHEDESGHGLLMRELEEEQDLEEGGHTEQMFLL